MALSAPPRAALLSQPVRLPRRTPAISPTNTSAKPRFGRSSGASFLARAKDSDENRTAVTDKFDAAEGFSYREGLAAEEAGKTDGEQGESSWDVLNKLNLELDSENTSAILIYGTSALVAVWISSAIVSALDSIPLVPRMLEVVGLGFTVWFASRYLIFKDSREELLTRIDSVKKQILGSDDD